MELTIKHITRMLKFELRTTPPTVPVVYRPPAKPKGIEVPWPMEEPWENYLKRLAPIGSLGVGVHEMGDYIDALKDGRRNVPVTVVVGYTSEPTGGIIMMGTRKVSPYILCTIYIPSKNAVYNPKPWIRECDGENTRILTPEETNGVLKNDTFLSLFEEWRQQTSFEGLGRDCLGASQRQVQSESGADGANQGHIEV